LEIGRGSWVGREGSGLDVGLGGEERRALALDLSDFAKQGTDVIHIHI
jgi:hypothetical protein